MWRETNPLARYSLIAQGEQFHVSSYRRYRQRGLQTNPDAISRSRDQNSRWCAFI